MDALLFSVNTVFPVLLLVIFGYVLKLRKYFSEKTIQDVDKLCFRILLPFSLFNSIYKMDANVSFDYKLVGFCIGGVILIVIVLSLLVPLFMHDRRRIGSFIQGVYRGNFLLLGLPLARNMFGTDGEQLIAMLLPFAIATFNIFAVIVLSIYGTGRDAGGKLSILKLVVGILKNPLIIATFLAVLVRLLPFSLPVFATKFIGDVGTMATPLALIMLGAQFNMEGFKTNIKTAAIATVLRLALIPVIMVGAAILLGWRGPHLGVIFILFSVPTAVSSHIMAINLGCDGDLAGNILIFTTLCSVFTLFFGTFILNYFALI